VFSWVKGGVMRKMGEDKLYLFLFSEINTYHNSSAIKKPGDEPGIL
jgi:hypothetical protein